MTMISVMFKVLIFALCAGAVIGVLVAVPMLFMLIYSIPYCLWVGNEQSMGRHKDKLQKKESLWRTARDATKVYGAWIRRTKPTL